jgi:hypothetical protein
MHTIIQRVTFTAKMRTPPPEFTSKLTGQTYHSKNIEHPNCSTENVVYGIECTLCGLIYVGETEHPLHTRLNGHLHNINNAHYKVMANHFSLPDHSILSMT